MASGDLIEATLRDLSAGLGALPRHRRHRIVTEARDHLVQASADVGVEEAVRRFGAPGELAAMHVQTAARRAPRRAVVVLGAAGLAYGMVQAVCSPAVSGVFPPGPWPNDEPPEYLAWKVDLAGALVVLAAACGTLAVVCLWSRRIADRRATQLAMVGAALFALSWPFETAFLVQRAWNVAGSPRVGVVWAICGLLAICHAVAVVSAGAAHRLRRATR